jgi:hypothetical protein
MNPRQHRRTCSVLAPTAPECGFLALLLRQRRCRELAVVPYFGFALMLP